MIRGRGAVLAALLAIIARHAAAEGTGPACRGGRLDALDTGIHQSTVETEDECRLLGKAVRIRLVSPTGCMSEHDMTLTLEQGGKTVEARWPGEYPTRWYDLHPGYFWKVGPSCTLVDSLDAGNGRVLLLLRQKGRPSPNRLVGVVYDVAKHQVVSMNDLLPTGDLVGRGARELWFRTWDPNPESIESIPKSIAYSSIWPLEKPVPLPDGDRIIFVGAVSDTNPVVHVWVDVAGAHAAVDWSRTFEFYKPFFASAQEFTRAFRKEDYWGHGYRWGRTAGGKNCIQPTPRAASKESQNYGLLPWYCDRLPRPYWKQGTWK